MKTLFNIIISQLVWEDFLKEQRKAIKQEGSKWYVQTMKPEIEVKETFAGSLNL